ncbi:hypothetical protein DRE_03304 [Drechslerella stenobrocha 248]|uniref:Uncharacterized protein n=1 Tax=Drechslerella stenobrocha 248 TaxID=1043628 RepID=W7HVX8_9PEZI|nr:hypothetical protein DRE_03304 [Drechslerella stenobrocha 248]
MGSIKLQIAHRTTPVPFEIPFKKAKDAKTLQSIIRTRTKCDINTKLTIYSKALNVIHWDDWEDMVEPNGRYMADLNDSWVKNLMAKDTVGNSLMHSDNFVGTLRATSVENASSNTTIATAGVMGRRQAAVDKPRKTLARSGPSVTARVFTRNVPPLDTIHEEAVINEPGVKKVVTEAAIVKMELKATGLQSGRGDGGRQPEHVSDEKKTTSWPANGGTAITSNVESTKGTIDYHELYIL